jgi:signal transduction histidine kinase
MSVHAIIPLVSFLAYIPLIRMIVLRRPGARVHRVFALYLTTAMVWSFTSFIAHLDPYPAHTPICVKLIITTCVWMTVTYYHFVRAYLNKPNGLGVSLGYVFLGVIAILVATQDFPRSAETSGGALHIEYGPLFYLLPAFLFPLTGMAAFSLVQRFRGLSDSLGRRTIVYLLIGMAVVVIGAGTNVISSLGVYPIDHIANLANALIIFYAVMRYQLLHIRIVVRRGLPYSVLTVLITAIYLLLLYTIQTSILEWPSYGSIAAAAGLALLFAMLFHPLVGLLQRAADRLIYGSTYDYRQTMLTFSDRMSNVLNLEELAENMLYPITKALSSRRVYLFLPEGEGGDFVARFVQPPVEGPDGGLRLGKDNPVLVWLARERKALHRETIDIAPMFKALWQSETEEIDALELALFCPIMRKGSLIGVVGLGRKFSDRPYSGEDVDLVTTMATEAAIVMENAMMLDNLKEQQEHVERLLAKTVLAQEEERRRIAVELHDSVAQWLVGASYRTQSCGVLLSGSDSDMAQTELTEIENTIDRSLKEIRRVMLGLHPPALEELGLAHALRQLLEGLKPEGVAYHFETEGELARLPESSELAIYRVVQEALNNVRKHSGASAVVVRLRFDPETVLVEIHDNGSGFNLARTMRGAVSIGHMGLLGMKERAGMLGGTVKVKSRPGKGTGVTLTLPRATPATAGKVGADESSSGDTQ